MQIKKLYIYIVNVLKCIDFLKSLYSLLLLLCKNVRLYYIIIKKALFYKASSGLTFGLTLGLHFYLCKTH